jgi:hypothetical protein
LPEKRAQIRGESKRAFFGKMSRIGGATCDLRLICRVNLRLAPLGRAAAMLDKPGADVAEW